MKAPETAIVHFESQESKELEYPNHKRAGKVYSSWMSGYTPEEIAEFEMITVKDVAADLRYITLSLPHRTVIAHNNDRSRILIQRQQSEDFQALLKRALTITADDYLAKGISPASTLREYREAVGMTEKPGAFVTFNTQQNFIGAQGNISPGTPRCAEDVIRRVLKKIEEQRVATPTLEATAVPVDNDDDEREEVPDTEDSIPESD
jgi:hypothetical protein